MRFRRPASPPRFDRTDAWDLEAASPDELRAKLRSIRALAIGVGRSGINNGMDQMADAVLRIFDQPT